MSIMSKYNFFAIVFFIFAILLSVYTQTFARTNDVQIVNSEKVDEDHIKVDAVVVTALRSDISFDRLVKNAINDANFAIIEQTGTYIYSENIIENGDTTKNKAIAIAATITQSDVLGVENVTRNGIPSVKVSVATTLNTTELREKSNLAFQNSQLVEENSKLVESINQLRSDLRNMSNQLNITEERRLRSKYIAATDRLDQYIATLQVNSINDTQGKVASNANEFYYLKLGSIYANNGDSQQAMNMFNKAISVNAGNPLSYFIKGTFLIKSCDYDDAIKTLTYSLKLDGTNAKTYANRADAYLKLNDTTSARSDYQKAISIEPNNAIFYNGMGEVYVAENNFAEANRFFKKAISLNAKLPQPYYNIALIYYANNDTTNALDYFTHASNLEFNDANYMISRIYLNQKNYPMSTNYILHYLQANPLNPDAMNILSINYYNTNNIANACLYAYNACAINSDKCGVLSQYQAAKLCTEHTIEELTNSTNVKINSGNGSTSSIVKSQNEEVKQLSHVNNSSVVTDYYHVANKSGTSASK